MIYRASNTKNQREDLFRYLEKRKYSRVLDIGGADNPWTAHYATAYFDMQDPHNYLKYFPNNVLKHDLGNVEVFLGDVNEPDAWIDIYHDVALNGKYDFCVCSHILEDIRDPVYVIKQMPKIAKGGYIGMPSVHWEMGQDTELLDYVKENKNLLDWGLTGTFKGFHHHRWIFTLKRKRGKFVLWAFPKLSFLEVMEGFEWVKGRDAWHELTFWWKDEIAFQVYNNDYVGPVGAYVCRDYRKQLTCEDL